MSAGLYVVIFHLARERTIRVGRLGTFTFPAGHYAYVGTAQRNLEERIARHRRRRKRLRWHVDYLSRCARLVAAYAWSLPRRKECALAEAVGRVPGAALAVPGFGASDCGCPGHLFRVP